MRLDIAILNGFLIDGAGNPWFRADVGVLENKIVRIGSISKDNADKVIDATGSYVTPGFIDAHSHSDHVYIVHPKADSMVRQGITTEVVGNCGTSAYPIMGKGAEIWRSTYASLFIDSSTVSMDWSTLSNYREKVDRQGLPVNLVPLVGHGSVRSCVIGTENRTPTNDEMEEMKSLVREAMRDGAFGMSSGLVYLPGCWAKTDELVTLARVVAEHGGIYTSHVRGERETIVEADAEAIEIGRRAGVPVEISHNGPKYGGWGKSKETLPLMEKAREEWIDVTFDNDTHTYLETSVGGDTLPQWLVDEGIDEKLRILGNPEKRKQIENEMITDSFPRQGPAGPLKHQAFERIVVFHAPRNRALIGKSIKEMANARNVDPWEAYFDLFVEERGNEALITDYMDESELQAISKHPLFMFCSDGSATSKELDQKRLCVPLGMCSYGEYANILRRWVREKNVLSLQEAIRKCTSFPAQRFGLLDRGLLRPGMIADIVVFDLEKMRDNATNLWPHNYPFENYPPDYAQGVRHVIVNGKIAVEENEFTGRLSGRCLDKREYL